MTFEHPGKSHTGQLLRLWKEAFGEYNGFWELFLETAFAEKRCRCVVEDGQVTAALCWFDCTLGKGKLAYIYAVATHPDHRGRGLCRALLGDVHRHLAQKGYAAALLVPAEEGLREMYRRLGYRECTAVREFTCGEGKTPVTLRAIGPGEYASLRREALPEGGVVQEGENLVFLARQAQFYVGEGVLLAAYAQGDVLHGMELLGDHALAPGIVTALHCKTGHFRTPGTQVPFAMEFPLAENVPSPRYFGFAFD